MRARDTRSVAGLAWALLCGCAGAPPSRFPSADVALSRMHASYACSRGVRAESKIDYFGENGRVRGNVYYLAALPNRLRFDVYSPFGITLATLTSDGRDFAFFDLRRKVFQYGPANTCNVARFTRVPVPPHALAQLLRGEAPVLRHDPENASIDWESSFLGSGRYVVSIRSTRSASERIELVPRPEDWNRPFAEQRVRVLKVAVEQQGYELYSAELVDHRAAKTAPPSVDPDGLLPPVPPSGPACDAEVPGRIRLEVPDTKQDLILRNDRVHHNPPLEPASFRQTAPAGTRVEYAACGG
jgi:hypothetical protein